MAKHSDHDHWEHKMKTYFTRIDFDHDGCITRKDFEQMAQKFIDQGKFDADKASDLKSTLTAVWDKYLSAVGGGDAISEAAFTKAMKHLVKDPKMKSVLEGPLPLFFHAVDSNNDGLISGKEYGEFFRILGLDVKLAEPAFRAIDTNNDGDISLEEFTNAGSEFFISDHKDCPSDIFWGPLIEVKKK